MIEITIIRDETTGEWIVRHPHGRKGDYYTNDYDDGTLTALAIGQECGFSINDISIRRKVRR